MPQFNKLSNWKELEIEVHPAESWRKILRFWPYFVGEKVQLELIVRKFAGISKEDLNFHLVEKLPDDSKPRIIKPTIIQNPSSNTAITLSIPNVSRITGKGEMKYWVSNQGYQVSGEPIFTAEAINLDSFIIQIILMTVGPIACLLAGLVLGLLLGGLGFVLGGL
jgi:hypothetical protein